MSSAAAMIKSNEADPRSLFGSLGMSRPLVLLPEAHAAADRGRALTQSLAGCDPAPDARFLDVFNRVSDPRDPFELRDLWLSRVESELGGTGLKAGRAEAWRRSRVRRSVSAEEVLTSRATVRFIKEMFNSYFRDDLFGDLRPEGLIALSGGSVDETAWGLPEALKACLRYALDRDWYGYSDSRGRISAREAIAGYESARIVGGGYSVDNVAISMGGTFTISTLADFLLSQRAQTQSPALCAIPNYPPLVESIARRGDIKLVPLAWRGGETSLAPLIAALTPTTPLVMLQTVANPTGVAVDEAELAELIRRAAPSTMIVLDECHQWLGRCAPCAAARRAANVIRVSSISKTWSAPGLKVGWFLADAALIADYYEFASTTFGGPPSYFYTLVEVLARMERWLESGIVVPGNAELQEFEGGYGVGLADLQVAFESYRVERLKRAEILEDLREATLSGLADAGATSITPRYSINVTTQFPGYDDSYLCFRRLLADSNVSVFPGLLTFCLSGGLCRVTAARGWTDLSQALKRLQLAPSRFGPAL